MTQPATSPKIEELRFKVKTDPKSRLFYPLAEELRKVGQLTEAEQVLRTGLAVHGTYLSAWVGLGRVLRDQKKDREAVEPLTKALELDRGNVVAARLLADTYLALDEKVEAIKKYKLVHALLPTDEEVEGIIQRLETELDAAGAARSAPAPPAAAGDTAASSSGDVFDVTYSKLAQKAKAGSDTGDAEPMSAAHSESPFEDTSPGAAPSYTAAAFEVEQPAGMHAEPAPVAAEVPAPVGGEEADVFEPAESEIAPGFIQGRFEANVPPPPPDVEDFSKTLTMADLFAQQGLIDDARDIYEDILARDPGNVAVQEKLRALSGSPAPEQTMEPERADEEEPRQHEPAPEPPAADVSAASPAEANPKVKKLEDWLSRVKRV